MAFSCHVQQFWPGTNPCAGTCACLLPQAPHFDLDPIPLLRGEHFDLKEQLMLSKLGANILRLVFIAAFFGRCVLRLLYE